MERSMILQHNLDHFLRTLMLRFSSLPVCVLVFIKLMLHITQLSSQLSQLLLELPSLTYYSQSLPDSLFGVLLAS